MRSAGSVAALAVIVLAAGLRLWRLDLAEFKNDEAGWLRLAEDMVRLGRVSLVGEGSSLQIGAPPHFIYFLAPFVALSRDVRFASSVIGLVNAAGVGGTVLLGWRAFSPMVGLAAGLAYAVDPWAVFFGRKVWNPEVVAPLTVLLFIALERAVVGRRAAWAAAAFPIATLGMLMHASVVAIAPLLLAPVVALVRQRQVRYLVVGLTLAVVVASPYLAYLSRHLSDVQTLEIALRRPDVINADGVARIIGLTGGWDNWYIDGVHMEFLLPGRVASVPGRVETVLLVVGFVIAAFLTTKSLANQRLRLAGLLLWLLLPAIVTLRHSVPLYDHYFLFVIPAGALLIGIGIQWFVDRWRPLGVVLLTALLGVAVIQVALVLREFDFLSGNYAAAYGPPLAHSEAMAHDVVQFGSSSSHLSVELEGPDREPIAYLTRPFFPEIDLADVGRVGFGTQQADAPAPIAPTFLKQNDLREVHYADGVRVLAASTSARGRPGEPVALALRWVADVPLQNELVWDVALLDPRGREVARGTGLRHSPSPGDEVVSWFTLGIAAESPVGAFTVRVRRLDDATSEFVAGTIEVFRE